MSIIVHQSDNMTILGEISYSEDTPFTDTSKEVKRTPYIQLTFVVHVNGRQKSFRHSFKLIQYKDIQDLLQHVSGQLEEYTLENWNEWHNVINTLESIWYTLSDHNDILPYQSYWQIRNWIETLMQYEQN